MKIEDIKVGETYYVRVKITDIKEKFFYAITEVRGKIERYSFYKHEAEIFYPIPPAVPTGGTLHQSDDDWLAKEKNLFNLMTGKKNTESAPKYDPCRLFKKGDKVRVVEWNGRNPVLPFMDYKVGDLGTVIKDEETTSFFVRLHLEGKYEKDMPYCHLELVTPVEELEPYRLDNDFFGWTVLGKDGLIVVRFHYDGHPHPKEAAEAECKRLNAEYRKERE